MGSCLKSCCCTEAGLRCHSVVTICGFAYFMLMFIIFDRQRDYFEFPVPDASGTQWSCLFSALLFLFWLIMILIKLEKLNKGKSVATKKYKIQLDQSAEYKNIYQERQSGFDEQIKDGKINGSIEMM